MQIYILLPWYRDSIPSMMFRKCKTYGAGIALIFAGIILSGWNPFLRFAGDSGYIESCLQNCFNDSEDNVKLKKWELKVTEKGFFRLRKHFPKGKQEYYSFNIKKFAALDYWGTEESGLLVIKTANDDVIVQTYNDPSGNVDSMSNSLKIPLKNITLGRLDSLERNLFAIKATLK